MPLFVSFRDLISRLQWQRGLRAAIVVAAAIGLCRACGQPFGWAALGGFEAILVDNGGSYRSRLNTILTVLIGGAVAGVLGGLVGGLVFGPSGNPTAAVPAISAILASAAICFGFTFARVLTQPLASTSVIILVIYFCGLGNGQHQFTASMANSAYFVAGGLGAALISLFLWPLDPFRPARQSVAAAYALLAKVTADLAADQNSERPREDHTWKRQARTLLEDARAALVQTAARMPARTVRARSLAVLLEAADMLFARVIRLVELADATPSGNATALHEAARWLSRCGGAVSDALRHPPHGPGELDPSRSLHAFGLSGQPLTPAAPLAPDSAEVALHLAAEVREAREELATAIDAVRAYWSGIERTDKMTGQPADASLPGETILTPVRPDSLADKLRADWSVHSLMFRHAVRMAAVGGIDVLLLHGLHLNHGFWLGMTSIIVLQPTGSGTLRRAWQRVGGTMAGGIFAAGLAASIGNEAALLAVVTLCAGLTLACFAVDYGLYSFFLTPTFVLLALPHLQDWRFAGIRMETTVLGAAIALLAMRLLWPGREQQELARLLQAGAVANADYLRALPRLWVLPELERQRVVSGKRRACGLASNAAEETLERFLLQPAFGRRPAAEIEQALASTTYLRRLTQSITTLAALGLRQPAALGGNTAARLEMLASRLAALHFAEAPVSGAAAGIAGPGTQEMPGVDLLQTAADDRGGDMIEWQMRRMERQAAVLERAASAARARELAKLATG